MFGIEALDVVIGLIFVYLLFSLFVSIVNEILSRILNVRGKELRFAIEKMIGLELRNILYSNQRIDHSKYKSSLWYGTPFWWFRKLFNRSKDIKSEGLDNKIARKSHPSVITTNTFTDIIFEIIANEDQRNKLFAQAPFLKTAYENVNQDVNEMRDAIDTWFDEVMSYTTSWYKEKLKIVLILLGFVTAAIFNVDTITVVNKLADDPQARAILVEQAESFVDRYENIDGKVILKTDTTSTDTLDNNPVEVKTKLTELREMAKSDLKSAGYPDSLLSIGTDSLMKTNYPSLIALDSLYGQIQTFNSLEIKAATSVLGLGWSNVPKFHFNADIIWIYLKMIFGWIITALAISMGAPFWYDSLRRVINIKKEVRNKV